jgi:hypothetical protein
MFGTGAMERFRVLVREHRAAGCGKRVRNVKRVGEQFRGEVTPRFVVTVKCAVQRDHRERVIKELEIHRAESYRYRMRDSRERSLS